MHGSVNNKKQMMFFTVNAAVFLLAGYFILISCRGSFFRRLASFKYFTPDTLKFIVKTGCFFAGGFIIWLVLFILLKTTPVSDESLLSSKKPRHLLFVGWRFYFAGLLMVMLKGWAMARFPMDEPEFVYYTLMNLQGSFDKSIIFEIIAICLFRISFVLYVNMLLIDIKKNTGYIFLIVFLQNVLILTFYIFYSVFFLYVSVLLLRIKLSVYLIILKLLKSTKYRRSTLSFIRMNIILRRCKILFSQTKK